MHSDRIVTKGKILKEVPSQSPEVSHQQSEVQRPPVVHQSTRPETKSLDSVARSRLQGQGRITWLGCNEIYQRGSTRFINKITAVPGHRQQKLRQNLIVRLLETHPLTTILENQQKRNVLVTRPCGGQADLLTFPEDFMTSGNRCREWTPETHLRNVIKMASFQAILAFVLALPYTNISS